MLISLALASASSLAATIQLVDGRTLTGKWVKVGGVAEDPTNPTPGAGEVKVESILVIDDGLRRTFVCSRRVRDILDAQAEKPVLIRLWQNDASYGAAIGRVGRLVRVTPFDEFGRRVYEMQAAGGPLSVVQGITEVTPVYTRVKGLVSEPRSYVWDMRIATSSIPRQSLSRILNRVTADGDAEARLQVVRLYLQSKRFRDARRELEAVAKAFPEMVDLEDDIRQLRQLGARTILDEIELRRDSGQLTLSRALLKNFPSEEVAGATLERVRELLAELDASDAQRKLVNQLITEHVSQLKEPAAQKVAKEIQEEIARDLNSMTLPRMAAYLQLAQGDALSAEQRVALAVSGWLLGTNRATDNLAVALSLVDVRTKVLEYLREKSAINRDRLLVELRDMEGSGVDRVAELLKLIKPPLEIPADSERGPGCHELSVSLGRDETARYFIQLPPEYDPLRSYPTIITLAGEGYTPQQQLDYWAGPPNVVDPKAPPVRRGQAMRHGYITIAVDWRRRGQFNYEYSAREHQIVLAAYRDAMRRFAIDTNRVFLTGHDIGGDAAWDIGLAHPDMWAGVMPFIASADRYVGWYWQNAEYVPMYIVAGEMDGTKMADNSRELDRYLKKPRFDATVVEFLGRGHEPFSDEIQRLFDWMGRKKRGPSPGEFTTYTMRPWDNFFWWVEFADLPTKSMVHPTAWPPRRGVRAARLQCRKYEGNKLGVIARAGRTTVWLSPDVVDFDQPIKVELNGRSIVDRDNPVQPELSVLMEDVRTRGDRWRPFWAKVESP